MFSFRRWSVSVLVCSGLAVSVGWCGWPWCVFVGARWQSVWSPGSRSWWWRSVVWWPLPGALRGGCLALRGAVAVVCGVACVAEWAGRVASSLPGAPGRR
jgi:hypothetical protein